MLIGVEVFELLMVALGVDILKIALAVVAVLTFAEDCIREDCCLERWRSMDNACGDNVLARQERSTLTSYPGF